MIYIAYLLVTMPMLRGCAARAAQGRQGEGVLHARQVGAADQHHRRVLGRLHGPEPGWPRKDIYNATEPFHWYLQYGAFLFIGVVFFGGLAYYWFVQRHKTGVLASHALSTARGRGAGAAPRRPPE